MIFEAREFALSVQLQLACVYEKAKAGYTTEYTLRNAFRECGALGTSARGYALYKIYLVEGRRATYAQGNAPSIAQSLGRLARLFCFQQISEKKDSEALPNFSDGAIIGKRSNASVVSSPLNGSAYQTLLLPLPTSMAISYSSGCFAEQLQ